MFFAERVNGRGRVFLKEAKDAAISSKSFVLVFDFVTSGTFLNFAVLDAMNGPVRKGSCEDNF